MIHSALPEALSAAVDEVLGPAGVEHLAHGDEDPVRAASAAASDAASLALIGPYRSLDVAEAIEATATAGLALLAPFATWVGLTRADEPGCEDEARHGGTILRLVARDSVVASRLAARVTRSGGRALVIAGGHDYGNQLDAQLRSAGLPRSDDPAEADLIVLCGLAGEPEVERAAALAALPVIAFDGIQGAAALAGADLRLALPFGPPEDGRTLQDALSGAQQARRAAGLAVAALRAGARERGAMLAALRALGPFDEHGDPLEPLVWLWRARENWALEPEGPV